MPHGLKRFQEAETLHFITFSCFHRLPFLATANPRDTVEAVLEQMRARHRARVYAARVYAYVLMPEHIHLLINLSMNRRRSSERSFSRLSNRPLPAN
uniref:Transposase IS200-like domain-containing protein n=1 Tax=mine drainage metagenome TaxID=410659 RepID=E6PX37_9ZZZZ